jgi:hypothetical protein
LTTPPKSASQLALALTFHPDKHDLTAILTANSVRKPNTDIDTTRSMTISEETTVYHVVPEIRKEKLFEFAFSKALC